MDHRQWDFTSRIKPGFSYRNHFWNTNEQRRFHLFTVKVSDNSTQVKGDTKQYTVTIAASGALIITTTRVKDGVENTAYNATSCGFGRYITLIHGVVASGNLPDGLTIDPTTGIISGTPTKNGKFGFTIQVTDDLSPAKSDTQQFSIHIAGN